MRRLRFPRSPRPVLTQCSCAAEGTVRGNVSETVNTTSLRCVFLLSLRKCSQVPMQTAAASPGTREVNWRWRSGLVTRANTAFRNCAMGSFSTTLGWHAHVRFVATGLWYGFSKPAAAFAHTIPKSASSGFLRLSQTILRTGRIQEECEGQSNSTRLPCVHVLCADPASSNVLLILFQIFVSVENRESQSNILL